MSHRHHRDRRSVGLAWLRLAAALAVMLLAVLPHATLAASAGHAVPAAGSLHHPAGHHDPATPSEQPCHESARPEPAGHGAMPSCCILGCGLIATSPALAEQIVPARFDAVVPMAPERGDALSPEPAERPPRAYSELA
jgi:hypothetical protein